MFSAINSHFECSYWGQDASGHQQRLSYYCQDDVYDTIPLAFLYVFFGTGGEPMMSFANVRIPKCSLYSSSELPL